MRERETGVHVSRDAHTSRGCVFVLEQFKQPKINKSTFFVCAAKLLRVSFCVYVLDSLFLVCCICCVCIYYYIILVIFAAGCNTNCPFYG